MVDMEAGKLAPQTLVDITTADDMKGIRIQDDQLIIGAAVTLTEIARSPLIKQYFPSPCKGAGSVGSLQIRNSATMVTTPRPAEPVRDQTIFTDEPKYIGDEVAAVAAETEAIAAEAIKRIKVEYEVLPAVYAPVEALKPDSPEVQPLYGNKEHHNVCGEIVRVTFCEHEPYSDEALERGFGTPQGTAVVEACVVTLNKNILAGTKLYALYLPRIKLFTCFELGQQKINSSRLSYFRTCR